MDDLRDLRRRLRERLKARDEGQSFLPGPAEPTHAAPGPAGDDDSFLPAPGSGRPTPSQAAPPAAEVRPDPAAPAASGSWRSDAAPARSAPPDSMFPEAPRRPPAVPRATRAWLGEAVEQSTAVGPYALLTIDGDAIVSGAAAWLSALHNPSGRSNLARTLQRPPERIVFLDLETCGLRGAPLFLCGTARAVAGRVRLELLLARDLSEEAAAVTACAQRLAAAEAVVTFNGQAFDLPFLAERARLHRVPLALPAIHCDLLRVARQRVGRAYGNCRLQTLERHLCGRQRPGDDVPSHLVPEVYERFCRSGDAALLDPILEHNAHDLLTCLDLLGRFAGGAA